MNVERKYKIPWFPILQIEQPFQSFSVLFLFVYLFFFFFLVFVIVSVFPYSIDCWLISLPFIFFVHILLAVFFCTNSAMPPCSQQLLQPYKLTAYIKP